MRCDYAPTARKCRSQAPVRLLTTQLGNRHDSRYGARLRENLIHVLELGQRDADATAPEPDASRVGAER
jgi:hypothetical protein